MSKGFAKIIHYFTADIMNAYNTLISACNAEKNKSYKILTDADITGAGNAFDTKYAAMLEDYATCAPDESINNKCFVRLQGERDGGCLLEISADISICVLLWLGRAAIKHKFIGLPVKI